MPSDLPRLFLARHGDTAWTDSHQRPGRTDLALSEAGEARACRIGEKLREANRAWHGIKLNEPDWGNCSHSIALGAELRGEGLFFHLILNSYWEPLEFELPVLGDGSSWRRWIDTALDSQDDIVPWQTAPDVSGRSYRCGARSLAMLFAESRPGVGRANDGS